MSAVIAPGTRSLAQANEKLQTGEKHKEAITIYTTDLFNLICLKEFTGLFVGGASSYTWSNGYFGNSQSVNPSVTTLYTVSGANAYGCLNTATVIVQVQTCQSISFESLSSEPQILLVHDMQGTQWIKGSQEITNLTYLFSDLNGKTCLMGSLESAQINCNMLYPGVYIVKLFKNLQGISCQRILLYK